MFACKHLGILLWQTYRRKKVFYLEHSWERRLSSLSLNEIKVHLKFCSDTNKHENRVFFQIEEICKHWLLFFQIDIFCKILSNKHLEDTYLTCLNKPSFYLKQLFLGTFGSQLSSDAIGIPMSSCFTLSTSSLAKKYAPRSNSFS